MRASFGATRRQLFAQFLAESLALAAIGGAAGVGLAWGLLKLIMAMMPPFPLPSEADVRLNIPVLLFTLGAVMLSGVLFGCAPAWQAARLNLNDVLKEGGRFALSAGRHGLRRTLVVVEFALALSLLAGGGACDSQSVECSSCRPRFSRRSPAYVLSSCAERSSDRASADHFVLPAAS